MMTYPVEGYAIFVSSAASTVIDIRRPTHFHTHLRAGEQVIVLDLSALPRGFVVREMAGERVIHGPARPWRQYHHLAVLFPAPGIPISPSAAGEADS